MYSSAIQTPPLDGSTAIGRVVTPAPSQVTRLECREAHVRSAAERSRTSAEDQAVPPSFETTYPVLGLSVGLVDAEAHHRACSDRTHDARHEQVGPAMTDVALVGDLASAFGSTWNQAAPSTAVGSWPTVMRCVERRIDASPFAGDVHLLDAAVGRVKRCSGRSSEVMVVGLAGVGVERRTHAESLPVLVPSIGSGNGLARDARARSA